VAIGDAILLDSIVVLFETIGGSLSVFAGLSSLRANEISVGFWGVDGSSVVAKGWIFLFFWCLVDEDSATPTSASAPDFLF
jgi:hypothetical protein